MNFAVALCRKGVLSTQKIPSRRSPTMNEIELLQYLSEIHVTEV